MRRACIIIALMFCARVIAQDASLIGAWKLQTPHLLQQLELNRDGTYQRSIVTTGSRRTEIGRWHSDVSVLMLQPDHVITTQGARVPLPPRDKQIDVAGVDANSMTLYYDGDAVETWQRLPVATAVLADRSSPQPTTTAATEVTPPPQPLPRRAPRAIALPTPQVQFTVVRIGEPAMPNFLIAPRSRQATLKSGYDVVASEVIAMPRIPAFSMAAAVPFVPPPADGVAVMPAVPRPVVPSTPTGLYPEASVVELITQIACEELRYPQRDPAASRQRYQRIAQALGFESRDAARLQRTLRYYQSNAEFLREHQLTIAENSMRCLTLPEQVSTR